MSLKDGAPGAGPILVGVDERVILIERIESAGSVPRHRADAVNAAGDGLGVALICS
jgi:hypothetical protein